MKDEIKEILEYVLSLTYGNENAIKGINKVEDYIINLQEENERLKIDNKRLQHNEKVFKSRNEKAIENIDLVIELIKQQPTEDDTWILNRLNGFKYILTGGDEE